jgi:membrane protease YdiL (CAAX protease family)
MFMSGDLKTQFYLFLVIALVGMGFLIADVIIFIRWLLYRYELYNLPPAVVAPLPQTPPPTMYELPPPAFGGEALYPRTEAAEIPLQPEPTAPAPATAYEPQREMPRYPFARTWSLVDPFLAIQVVIILINVLAGIPLVPLILTKGQDAIYSSAGILIQVVATILLNVLFIAVVAFYVHRYGTTLKEIGLRSPTPAQIGMGIGLGIALAILAQGTEIGMGVVLPHILPKSVYEGLAKLTQEVTAGGMFEKIPSLNLKLVFALAGVIAAPIGEEIFFRGFLYNALKRRLNIPAAIVISGFLFAVMHIGPLAIVIIFPMGMALAYVYERTRSLWVTILMHIMNNGLAFGMALLFPHLGENPANRQKPIAPPPVKHAAVITVPVSVLRGAGQPNLQFLEADNEMRRYKISQRGRRV